MAEVRNYRSGVRSALLALCGGTCYWPKCDEPVVRFVDDVPVNNLQIAHIRAARKRGPRYVPDMSSEERDAFSNLILLCHPHHIIVDRIEKDRFTIETLLEWKNVREADAQGILSGLRGVSEDRLQELISEAVMSRDQEVQEALTKFKDVDSEAARLLEGLISELYSLRRHGSILDPDLVDMLSRSSHRLSMLPDTADTLMLAARQLSTLPETAERLQNAAGNISGLSGLIDALSEAANRLRRVQGNM